MIVEKFCEAWRATCTPMTRRERLHYQTVVGQGAPIGSGAVESACAQLRTRLKGPGKFWSIASKNHLPYT